MSNIVRLWRRQTESTRKPTTFARIRTTSSRKKCWSAKSIGFRKSYGQTVTPELVALDDGGKLIQRLIALEAILSESAGTQPGFHDPNQAEPLPPALVAERDRKERGRLPLSFHWKNHAAQWLPRTKVGLPGLLHRLINDDRPAAAPDCRVPHELSGSRIFLHRGIKG